MSENYKVNKTSSSFYYGWVIVCLSHFTLAFHVVTRFSFGIFQVPLIEEFEWGRGLLGGAFALSMATYALGAPIAGSLLDKYGPRAVMPWGSVVLGITLIASYFISSIFLVYLLIGFCLGGGLALSGFATHSAIMPRWFIRKRGRATGIALSSIGIGILFLAPILERLIAIFGWRVSYLIFGLVILFIIAPSGFLLLRDHPEDIGQGPDGTLPRSEEDFKKVYGDKNKKKGIRDVFKEVRHDKKFWFLMVIVFGIGFNNNTIMSQLALYLIDIKYLPVTAAIIFGSVGFIRTVGSVIGGWVGDLVGRAYGVSLASFIVGMGIVYLIFLPNFGSTLTNGFVFALIYGTGTGAMSACYSALCGDCFEGANYGIIIGFMEICYGLGGVLGAPFAGFVFDTTKSYMIPFITISCLMFFALFLAILLNKTIQKESKIG